MGIVFQKATTSAPERVAGKIHPKKAVGIQLPVKQWLFILSTTLLPIYPLPFG
jgi:cytochrome c oxidase subunit IV